MKRQTSCFFVVVTALVLTCVCENGTVSNTTNFTSTTLKPTTQAVKIKTEQVETNEEKEKHGSMTIFFVLSVLGLCIISIHIIIKTKFSYLPESVAVVFLGFMIGGIIKLLQKYDLGNWQKEELFDPTIFFLILLPPIIFESGYNLHKGNFFANLGSIVVFAVFGTIISAVIVGGSIYFLGKAKIAHQLDFKQSFTFGSLISAVDPVATLAIFHAINADPLLNMLVFGESILNDAVAIVLTKAVLKSSSFSQSVIAFITIFFGSSAIGVAFALVSALILKYIDLRQHPSLELGMMVIFSYAPYQLAEGLQLSGIMAVLFCGIVMSHYTHFNLSPVTQITVQHLFRTAAFVSETCVFVYLGLSIFGFDHKFEASFIIWSIVLILIGRAANVFPLSFLLNYFRETKIKRTNQLIMWFSGMSFVTFSRKRITSQDVDVKNQENSAIKKNVDVKIQVHLSMSLDSTLFLCLPAGVYLNKPPVIEEGLRGAIAFALAINLEEFDEDTRRLLVTTTLVIVLFTLLVLGGSTLPLLKCLNATQEENVTLSKTAAEGSAVDADQMTDDERRINNRISLKGFTKMDARYFVPFFTRRVTRQEKGTSQDVDVKNQEIRAAQHEMQRLTAQWYNEIRDSPSVTDEEEVEVSTAAL